mmetsp:Transcript_17858/g.45312  ORF Transcript_17858/g.45312 Transcript_17858/m.45312 type:complete len:275 (-) Transcript_17858:4-828(-)
MLRRRSSVAPSAQPITATRSPVARPRMVDSGASGSMMGTSVRTTILNVGLCKYSSTTFMMAKTSTPAGPSALPKVASGKSRPCSASIMDQLGRLRPPRSSRRRSWLAMILTDMPVKKAPRNPCVCAAILRPRAADMTPEKRGRTAISLKAGPGTHLPVPSSFARPTLPIARNSARLCSASSSSSSPSSCSPPSCSSPRSVVRGRSASAASRTQSGCGGACSAHSAASWAVPAPRPIAARRRAVRSAVAASSLRRFGAMTAVAARATVTRFCSQL